MRIEPLECIIVDAGEFKNTTFLIHVIVTLKHQIYVLKEVLMYRLIFEISP